LVLHVPGGFFVGLSPRTISSTPPPFLVSGEKRVLSPFLLNSYFGLPTFPLLRSLLPCILLEVLVFLLSFFLLSLPPPPLIIFEIDVCATFFQPDAGHPFLDPLFYLYPQAVPPS